MLNALANELDNAWFVTRRNVRTADDIVRIATQYRAQHAIDLVYVDNARAVEAPESKSKFDADRRLAASRMYSAFANWSDTHQVPLGILAHTSRKYFERTHGRGPPVMSDIGETSDAEKDVRLLLSLWKRRGQLRVTIGKQNEGRVDDEPTVELAMLGESALVDAHSGLEVNLRQEEREERERKEDAKLEASRRQELEQAKWRTTVKEPELAKVRAARSVELKPVEPAPQAELGLEVQPATKPTPLVVLDGGKTEEPKP